MKCLQTAHSKSIPKHLELRRSSPTILSSQQGAVLIVVLLFLVMIALAGTLAVRQSHTDLRVATSDQINTIMLQSSDSANQQLEMVINGPTNSTLYKDIMSRAGTFGYYILEDDSVQNEYVYCFNTLGTKYLRKYATIKKPGGGTLSSKGYCDFKNANGYTNNRQVVMTQMNVIPTSAISKNSEPFGDVVIGKDIDSGSSKKFRFSLRATSAIPAYSSRNPTNCFKKTMVDDYKSLGSQGGQTLVECLRDSQTPAKVLYEQADLENASSSTICIPFGKSSTLNPKCALANTGG